MSTSAYETLSEVMKHVMIGPNTEEVQVETRKLQDEMIHNLHVLFSRYYGDYERG